MSRTRLLSLLATAVLASAATLAAEPTSPAQRADMIRRIEALETKPFAADADPSRQVVMDWLTEAPDVTVTVCGALLVDIDKLSNDADGSGLLMQLMFSEARFILEHPEQAADQKAVHAAGVEGVLRTYAAMKAEKGKLRIAPIEKLVQIKADGKLPEFVARSMDQCN